MHRIIKIIIYELLTALYVFVRMFALCFSLHLPNVK
jgi:hypothetical protein